MRCTCGESEYRAPTGAGTKQAIVLELGMANHGAVVRVMWEERAQGKSSAVLWVPSLVTLDHRVVGYLSLPCSLHGRIGGEAKLPAAVGERAQSLN